MVKSGLRGRISTWWESTFTTIYHAVSGGQIITLATLSFKQFFISAIKNIVKECFEELVQEQLVSEGLGLTVSEGLGLIGGLTSQQFALTLAP